jgi:hypothetical protein
MGFAKFMSSTSGRLLRGIAGFILLAIGIAVGGAWLILSAVGLVFIAVGAFDVCLLAPLFKQPMSGKKVRAGLK